MRVPSALERKLILSCRNVGGPGGVTEEGDPDDDAFAEMERLGWIKTRTVSRRRLGCDIWSEATPAGVTAVQLAILAETWDASARASSSPSSGHEQEKP